MLPTWAAFFRTNKTALLAVGIALLRTSRAERNDTLAVADEGTTFDEAPVVVDGWALAITIQVLWIAVFTKNGGLVLACFDGDMKVAITCSQRTSMMIAYDLRDDESQKPPAFDLVL